MRAWLTQATVRALFGEGCGDLSLTTVCYDPGRIGLPHPIRLIGQKTIRRQAKIQGRSHKSRVNDRVNSHAANPAADASRSSPNRIPSPGAAFPRECRSSIRTECRSGLSGHQGACVPDCGAAGVWGWVAVRHGRIHLPQFVAYQRFCHGVRPPASANTMPAHRNGMNLPKD